MFLITSEAICPHLTPPLNRMSPNNKFYDNFQIGKNLDKKPFHQRESNHLLGSYQLLFLVDRGRVAQNHQYIIKPANFITLLSLVWSSYKKYNFVRQNCHVYLILITDFEKFFTMPQQTRWGRPR